MHLVWHCMIKTIADVNHIIVIIVFKPEVRVVPRLPSPAQCYLRHWTTLGCFAFVDRAGWLEQCARLTNLLQRLGQHFTIMYDLDYAASITNINAANLVDLEASEPQAMLVEQPVISNGEVLAINPG